MTSLVDVSQADREAAARQISDRGLYSPIVARKVQEGRGDELSIVQAFARHRLTAEQAKDAEIERLRERVAELEAGARALLYGPLDLAQLNRALDGLGAILNRERDNATG